MSMLRTKNEDYPSLLTEDDAESIEDEEDEEEKTNSVFNDQAIKYVNTHLMIFSN